MAKVYYHKNCVDGFGAAFACWLKNPDWDYEPIQYGEDHLIPEVLEYVDEPKEHYQGVYFLDFCPTKEVIEMLHNKGIKPVILDHHLTKQTTFADTNEKGWINGIFDLNRSGAMISYFYFKPEQANAHLFFSMIQDRDLWQFKVLHSKALHAYLIGHLSFTYFLEVIKNMQPYIDIGYNLLEQTNSIVEKCCKSFYFQHYALDLKDPSCPAVNSPIHQSEICDKLLKDFPDSKFVACEYRDGNKFIVSLRSRKDFDCSVIAAHYGGGGHAQASGFVLKMLADK